MEFAFACSCPSIAFLEEEGRKHWIVKTSLLLPLSKTAWIGLLSYEVLHRYFFPKNDQNRTWFHWIRPLLIELGNIFALPYIIFPLYLQILLWDKGSLKSVGLSPLAGCLLILFLAWPKCCMQASSLALDGWVFFYVGYFISISFLTAFQKTTILGLGIY